MTSKMIGLRLVAGCVLSVMVTALGVRSETATKPAACSAPEYHQFDFWIGDWDVFDMDKPNEVVARARVDRILDGCVLQEDYQQNDGFNGQSFNTYDASRKVWHESWVTNKGSMLLFEGTLQSGAMLMNAVSHKDGNEVLIRDTWKLADGVVRETAMKSSDGGKTWTTMFDMGFRAHKQTQQ